MARLVLASASPRRRSLLKLLCRSFTCQSPDIDETPIVGESPAAMVRRLAIAKALEVRAPSAVVLAADTEVFLDGAALGKPGRHAASMLRRLAGRTHHVLTGVCVLTSDRKLVVVVKTAVQFRRLREAEVKAYVRSGEGRDKSGGYAFQGAATAFIGSIDGSPSNVMGLPLVETRVLLGRAGVAACQ